MQQIEAHIHNSTEGARHDPPIIIFGRAKEFDYKITEHDEYPYPYRRYMEDKLRHWRICIYKEYPYFFHTQLFMQLLFDEH